jgi:hypothetical protein
LGRTSDLIRKNPTIFVFSQEERMKNTQEGMVSPKTYRSVGLFHRLMIMLALLLLLLAFMGNSLIPSRISQKTTTAPVASSPATTPQEIEVTDCIWQHYWNPKETQVLLFPDLNSRYLATAMPVLKGEGRNAAHFIIRGNFPHARYFVWQNYRYGGGALLDLYADNMVIPDKGVNPVRKGDRGYAGLRQNPENSYTITIRDLPPEERPAPRPNNTLWGGFAEDGTTVDTNVVTMRIYGLHPLDDMDRVPEGVSPQDWYNQAQVAMPRYFYVIDDPEKAPYKTKEEVCQASQQNIEYLVSGEAALAKLDNVNDTIAPVLAEMERSASGLGDNPPTWFIGAGANFRKFLISFYPNSRLIERLFRLLPMNSLSLFMEANYYPNWQTGYIMTSLNPKYGENYVFRIKVPKFPHTEEGRELNYGSWSPSNLSYSMDRTSYRGQSFDEVRYWSICMYRSYLFAAAQCVRDYQIKVDEDGYATIVVSSAKNKPQSDPQAGPDFNWIVWDSPISVIGIRQIYTHPGYVNGSYWYKEQCEANPSYHNRNCLYDSKSLARFLGDYQPYGVYCSPQEYEQNRCGVMDMKKP